MNDQFTGGLGGILGWASEAVVDNVSLIVNSVVYKEEKLAKNVPLIRCKNPI